MVKSVPNLAQNEETFLVRNAYLSIVLGILFSALTLETLMAEWIEANALISNISFVFFFVVMIALVSICIATVSSAHRISKTSFWLSEFTDEFYNHANALAYKWAFNFIVGFLFIIYLLFDSRTVNNDVLPVAGLAQCTVGIGFLVYGGVILKKIKGGDDE